MRLIFGQLEPDKPGHLQEGLRQADNVYASPNGYRPIQAFSAITDALSGNFQGGGTFVASDGTVNLIAGNATNLYRYNASLSWSSIKGSLTADRWYFTQFGDVAIAVNGGAPIEVDLQAGTAANLAGSPPTASLCTTVRDFVVLGQANGEENLVRWSGFENHEQWTNGTNQAGEQPMLTGGAITGLAGGEYGLVFQRSRVTRMTYVGTPLIWQFDEISANIGCLAAGSIAQAGRLVFFYSDRGFQMTDGNDVRPIGNERIDRTFAEAYSPEDLDLMYATVDPKQTLVVWVMPGKAWIYNWALDRWSTMTWPVKAAFPGFTPGISLDDLDALFPDLDAMDVSLDDGRFAGGAPLLLVVNSSDEVGTLTGDRLAATIETPFIEMAEGRSARINMIRPITDAVDGVTVAISSRARLGDSSSTESFATMQASGDMPCRASGRYLKEVWTIAEGTDWTFLQGADHNQLAVGGRR